MTRQLRHRPRVRGLPANSVRLGKVAIVLRAIVRREIVVPVVAIVRLAKPAVVRREIVRKVIVPRAANVVTDVPAEIDLVVTVAPAVTVPAVIAPSLNDAISPPTSKSTS